MITLRSAVAEYVRDCAVGLAASTVRAYAWAVGHLVDYLPGRELASVTHLDLRAFFAGLRQRGYGDASRHQHYRSIRTFFGWCLRQSYIATNPIALVRVPGLAHPARAGLSLADVGSLLSAAARGQKAERDAAILLLLLDTGLRRRELVGVQVSDVDFDACTLVVRLGKGRRGRVVPVSPVVLDALRVWLALRGSGRGSLFGLSSSGLNLLFRRLARRSGVKVSPHIMRHTFASLYKGDIEDLRVILGHASVETTASIYRHRNVRDLVSPHAGLSPVALVKRQQG